MPYNSTIRVKEKICVSCGKPCIWFSKKRCQQCARVEDFYAKEAKIIKEDGLQDLVADLDILVSTWVRWKDVKNGVIKCYTCDYYGQPPQMDAGHYVSRGCMYLRFDAARNIRSQCHTCNRSNYGMAATFGKNLELELPGVTEVLLEESRIIYKYSRDELRGLISEYNQKIKLLQR